MAKKSIRITFTIDEAKEYYAHLGSKIGALVDGAAIRDQRPSEISEQVAGIRWQMDRIAEAVRNAEKETEVHDQTQLHI